MAPEQINAQPISHTRFCPAPLCIVTNMSVPFAKSGLCGRLPVFPLPLCGKAIKVVLCQKRQILALGDKPAKHAVEMLVLSTFPCTVGVCIIDINSKRFKGICGGKLRTVIKGNTTKHLVEIPAKAFLQLKERLVCSFGCFGFGFQDEIFIVNCNSKLHTESSLWILFLLLQLHFTNCKILGTYQFLGFSPFLCVYGIYFP